MIPLLFRVGVWRGKSWRLRAGTVFHALGKLVLRSEVAGVAGDGGVQVKLRQDSPVLAAEAGGLDRKWTEDGENVCLWERPN